jgi:ribosomal protein S27AE
MTVRPDYGPEFGEEERREQRLDELREEHMLPVERDELVEHEIEEQEEEERDNLYVDADDNELHAAGQVCARCGRVITAAEDVRLRADGKWQHEECPVDLTEQEAGQPGPASG